MVEEDLGVPEAEIPPSTRAHNGRQVPLQGAGRSGFSRVSTKAKENYPRSVAEEDIEVHEAEMPRSNRACSPQGSVLGSIRDRFSRTSRNSNRSHPGSVLVEDIGVPKVETPASSRAHSSQRSMLGSIRSQFSRRSGKEPAHYPESIPEEELRGFSEDDLRRGEQWQGGTLLDEDQQSDRENQFKHHHPRTSQRGSYPTASNRDPGPAQHSRRSSRQPSHYAESFSSTQARSGHDD